MTDYLRKNKLVATCLVPPDMRYAAIQCNPCEEETQLLSVLCVGIFHGYEQDTDMQKPKWEWDGSVSTGGIVFTRDYVEIPIDEDQTFLGYFESQEKFNDWWAKEKEGLLERQLEIRRQQIERNKSR